MKLSRRKLKKIIKEELNRVINEDDFSISPNGEELNTNGSSTTNGHHANGEELGTNGSFTQYANGEQQSLSDTFAKFTTDKLIEIENDLNYFGREDPTAPDFTASLKRDAMGNDEEKIPHYSIDVVENVEGSDLSDLESFEAFVTEENNTYHGFVYSKGTTPKEAAEGKKAIASGKTSEDESHLIAGAIVVGIMQATGYSI